MKNWLAVAKRALPWLLLLVALAILGYRWMNLGLCSFMLDEPQLLETARSQLETGHWATASPLLGNQGLHYGAAAVWVYGVIHFLGGPNPEVHIAAMGGLVMLTTILLAFSIGRLYGDRILMPATLLALIGSSPYQFIWSRMAWDQLTEIGVGLAVAWLCLEADLSLHRAAAVGTVLGLAASTHLMVGPMVPVLVGFAVLRSPPGRRLAGAAVVVGCAAIVTLPYLSYLASNPAPARQMVGMPWRAALPFLSGPFRVASVLGMSQVIGDWSVFSEASPFWAKVVDQGTQALSWLDGLVALVLVLTMLRSNSAPRRRVAGLTLIAWVAQAAYYAYRRAYDYSNYQWPTWWIAVAAAGAGLHLLRGRLRPLRPIAMGVVWIVALAQSAFLIRWMSVVREHGGGRGITYGTVIAEQRRLVSTACRTGGAQVWLKLEAPVFQESLRYLAGLEPACAGKQLRITDDPRHAEPGVRVRRVVYSPPNSAFLALE